MNEIIVFIQTLPLYKLLYFLFLPLLFVIDPKRSLRMLAAIIIMFFILVRLGIIGAS